MILILNLVYNVGIGSANRECAVIRVIVPVSLLLKKHGIVFIVSMSVYVLKACRCVH